MKKTVFILYVLFSAPLLFAEQTKVTISNIKVFIDDEESSPLICRETVLSYTALVAGKKISLNALEHELVQTELRLLASGLFYSAKVSVAPPRKNPAQRTVIITVQTGFFWRFGGGNAYGVFGKAGIGGKRLEVLSYAGWNKNGVSVLYEHVFDSPFIFESSLAWNGPASLFQADTASRVYAQLASGIFINPDIRLCIEFDDTAAFSTDAPINELCISPYIQIQKYFSKTVTALSTARLYAYPFSTEKAVGGEAVTALNWTSFVPVTFALCGAAGISSSHTNTFFNLGMHDSTLSEASFPDRIVRSGTTTARSNSPYSKAFCADSYIFASGEIRWNALTFTVPPAFTIELQPFIFTDMALLGTAPLYTDAFGGGLRVLFDNPVFAYFTLCYGINHSGNGRFIFAETKGF